MRNISKHQRLLLTHININQHCDNQKQIMNIKIIGIIYVVNNCHQTIDQLITIISTWF